MKQTPNEKDMSYMEKRDRNGCIGCMVILASVVTCALVLLMVDLINIP